jgi:hypothetical protein
MDSSVFGVLELLLVFGAALALAVYELVRVRRDIRRSKRGGDRGNGD